MDALQSINNQAPPNTMNPEELPFLKQVAVEQLKKIQKILLLKLSIEDRISRLEDYMTVSQLKECRKWMERKAGDFLSLLTDSDQEIAEEYFNNKGIPVLDAILQNYDEGTQQIYETWKKTSGFRPKEQKLAPAPKETPNSKPRRKVLAKNATSDGSDTEEEKESDTFRKKRAEAEEESVEESSEEEEEIKPKPKAKAKKLQKPR